MLETFRHYFPKQVESNSMLPNNDNNNLVKKIEFTLFTVDMSSHFYLYSTLYNTDCVKAALLC